VRLLVEHLDEQAADDLALGLGVRDVEQWLRAVMAPLETRVREHKIQLKRRLESVKRIHEASDTLEERIDELNQTGATLVAQLAQLDALKWAIDEALAPAQGLASARSTGQAAGQQGRGLSGRQSHEAHEMALAAGPVDQVASRLVTAIADRARIQALPRNRS
jgi:uncharacterized protein YgbK (DUF1537 family)